MLVELIENGIQAEKRKQQEFFELAGLTRTRPSGWGISLDAWSSAADAQD
jgi:hypothetical protein